MKKILSAVAAFGLVAGLASTASAVDFSVSGRYVAEGYYLSDAAGDGLVLSKAAGAADTGSDAYFVHSLKIAPVLQVNDKVKLVTDFWLADNNFWGNQNGGDVSGGGQGQALANNGNEIDDIEVWQAYIEYVSPIGKFRVGRTLSGPFGTSFLDTIGHNDRIMWWPAMLKSGPWSTLLKYQKGTEGDGMIGGANAASSDADHDYYEFDVIHKTDKGLGLARISFNDNQALTGTDFTKWRTTLSGTYKLPAFYINAEFEYQWGEKEIDPILGVAQPDRDVSGMGLFLQLGKQFGALDVSGMYIYASGDDDADTDDEALLDLTNGTGNEFEPYYILTGSHAGIFNGELYGTDGDATRAGLHSLGVHANYAMSERLMLHGAVAYHMAADEMAGWDDEYGIEYNVGGAYKLLDNLTYEVHFGYLDTGDFAKGGDATVDTESVYLASNHLTMTF